MSTVAGTGAEAGVVGTLEKVPTFDPHSPSTARLIDHYHLSSPSVFTSLKGTPSPSSSSSFSSHHHRHSSNLSLPLKSSQIGGFEHHLQNLERFRYTHRTESTTLHMPVSTRTKTRSSCKKKGKGIISLFSSSSTSSGTGAKKHQEQLLQAAAMEIARSASAIINQVQEPSEIASTTPLTPLDTHHRHHTHSSSHTTSSSNPTSLSTKKQTP